jgi:hypothetical protein
MGADLREAPGSGRGSGRVRDRGEYGNIIVETLSSRASQTALKGS